MVASQTDKNLALKKELGDGIKASDLKIEDIKKKLEEQSTEINTLKQKIESLERKVESGSHNIGTPSSGGQIPGW